MQATRLLPGLALLAALAAAACDDERSQICVPGRADRCPDDQTCNVDDDGAPRCISPGDQPEGAQCHAAPPGAVDPDPAGRCMRDLGCLRVAGVSRCLRFCDPTARLDACQPEGTIGISAAGVRLADFARCAALLPDRPEIGVCVLPCRPERRRGCVDDPDGCRAHPGDCPDGTTCGLSPAAPFPICLPVGDGARGDACGPRAPCAAGLLCTRLDGSATCRLPVDLGDACPADATAHALTGVDDPFGDGAPLQQICLP